MKECDENWMLGEWEKELPAPEELMPLTQTLITPDLAAAFKIERDLSPADSASAFSQSVAAPENLQTLIRHYHQMPSAAAGGSAFGAGYVQMVSAVYANNGNGSSRADDSGYGGGAAPQDSGEYGGAGKKPRKQQGAALGDSSELEEADSGGAGGGPGGGAENSNEEPAARTLKRPRLVWTPQLHKRFVDAVAHLGIKNAVPKTIMQLMSVEGLTRENVASHLQKYRLYLKRMQGLSSEGPSASDQLFASTPVPPSLAASAHFHHHHHHRDDVLPLAFSGPVVPLAVAGLGGHGHLPGGPPPYAGFDHHFFNSLARQQQQPAVQRISSPVPHHPHHHPQDFMMEAQAVAASSPPRKVLTLFPTGGN